MSGRGHRNGKIAAAVQAIRRAPADITAGWLMGEVAVDRKQALNAIGQATRRRLIRRVVRGVYRLRPARRAA